jgi:UDP-glucose 4-epimerase
MAKAFVTGGTGYIGSHTVVELLQHGWDVTIFDNLEKSDRAMLDRIEDITDKKPEFIKGDIREISDLREALNSDFHAVIHFAAYKMVRESEQKPFKYYRNNVAGPINVLKVMSENDINRFVFSSSCAIYGQPQYLPIDEKHPFNPLSVYARNKLMVERVLEDLPLPSMRLRYFNAAGAHPSGKIGEDPAKLMNVIPRLFGAALGKYEFKLFGEGFDTKDGTQIRDYIHVMDLARAHRLALEFLNDKEESFAVNVGTGRGVSVKQIIDGVKSVTGMDFDYEVVDANPTDPIKIVGGNAKAEELLGWSAKYEIGDMLEHAWTWYDNHREMFDK